MSDNIKVVVKVRPLIPREVDQKLPYAWRVQNNTLHQIDHHGRDIGACYTFDKVYDKDTKTIEVYNDVAKPIVEAAIAGFNGTIFAYGQTSSGKTYTISGTDKNPGIIPLAVWNLYDNIKKIPDRDFLVRVSYIEIYNETLKDLLNIDNKNIKIRDTLQGVKLEATEKVTCTPQEVLEIMKMGEANRQTGATNMNEESSRSHSIFQITIESREHIEDEKEAGCVNVSTLNLVDLAGSERSGQTGATGVRFKEGTHINKSLSVLALVIKQLSEDPNKYANYRDSKLTRILQNSLGGNAKTSIICAVTPASVEETVSTLQFANRAKAIKNKPEVNAVATDATMIQSLTKQLSKLQSELASKKNIEQDNANLQRQIENLHKMILNGFGQCNVMTGSKQKLHQLRRKTISTLRAVEEDPDPIVAKFSTPSLKYNPLACSTEFIPIQSSTKLATVTEETRLITPPPIERKVTFQNDIIQIDSDEESKPDEVPTCSPIHSCYDSSITPPCVLRKNAKVAEKNLKDLEELTEREKIYTPQVVELIEKLEHKASIISKLEDEVDALNKDNKEKDVQLQLLKERVDAAEQEVKTIASAKSLLESQCKENQLKLIDTEVSYDTLKKKSKTREDELLSLLEEKMGSKKACGDGGIAASNIKTTEMFNSTETPADMLALKTFLKDCGIVQTVDSEISTQIQDLVRNSQTELNIKNKRVLELEDTISTQKENIESLESYSQQLQTMVDCFKDKLANVEGENELLKSNIENLNVTVENQKKLLETANSDMKKCNSLISDLKVKLSKMEVPDTKINDSMLESLIANEENFIANNENMRNIIQSFKIILNMKSKEINESTKTIQNNSDLLNKNKMLLEQLDTKEKQINTLVEQVENMRDQLSENIKTINTFIQCEQENTNKLNDIEKQNDSLHNLNEQYAKQIKQLQDRNDQILLSMSENESKYQEASVKIEDMTRQIEDLTQIVTNYEKEMNAQKVLIESLTNKETKTQVRCTEAKTYLDKIKELTLMLNGDDFEIPETIDANDSFLNYLENSLSYLEAATKMIVQEKQQFDLNMRSLEDELFTIQTHNKTLCTEAKTYLDKIKDLTLMLNGDDFEIPDTIDANDSFLNYLGNSLSYLEAVSKTIVQEKQELELNMKSLEDKLLTIQTHNRTLSQDNNDVFLQNEKLSEQVTQLTNEATLVCNDVEVKTRDIAEKDIKLNEAGESNRHLQSEILSKENTIACLQEKVACLNLQIQNLLKDKEEGIMFSKEVEELKNTLKIQEESYTKLLKSKENEMAQALTNSFEEHSKLLNATKELNDALESRNYLLGIIMDKTSKMKVNYAINDNLSNEPVECDNFKHIIHTLDKIASYVETVSSMNTDDKNAKDLLLEAQTQISELSRQNLDLMNECSKIESKNQELLNELKMVKMINADLSESEALLDHLKVELKIKSEELDTMENKIRNISIKVLEQECLMKAEKDEIEKDKQKVKELQFQAQSAFTNQSDCNKIVEEKTNITEMNHIFPKSLKTISLNRVIECLLADNIKSPSGTTSNSSLNIADFHINPRTTACECISLGLELAEANKKIFALNNNLKQLQEINNNLLQEQEAVRQEIHLLLEPANELQKKINNHRTNLSTLTATTYTENKLLHSQLRVLKHHHKRYVHVCQRDLPGFKTQLNELMAILRNSSISDKYNNSFKRYSLPDVLDSNTTFKNDSTFDGNLLMLDTNITMTTTGDNTLVGLDQTCLDTTQTNFDSEETCNTNDLSKVLDPRLVYSQIVDIANDNQRIYEKVERLEVENQRLREQVAVCKSSPVNLNIDKSSSSVSSICEKCKNLEQLKTEVEKLQENIESISEDLSRTKSLKEEIEKKYNDLIIELPSSEALVKKLSVLEKEHNTKLQEINNLTSDLTKKTRDLKVLQEENDTLSNEIMDKVSEADDLTKELNLLKDTLENLNRELELAKKTEGSNKIEENCHQCTYELESLNERNIQLSQELEKLMKENKEINQATNSKCSQCAIKDELIISLQNSSESHSKLNKSLNESHNTSRLNKICTLQNELHASKEDCKKITEEVTTIKNQLERSNIALGESMDLDESMSDTNIFNFTKDFNTAEQQMDKFCLPHIAEQNSQDVYTADKTDCFNYYADKTGADKENLNYDMKILDVMKMLHNNILTKHANEVENLINKLKDFEESKSVLQSQIQNLTTENTKVTKELEEKENNIRNVVDMLSQIKESINIISLAVSTPTENKNNDVVLMFKEHLLEVVDSQFGLSTAKVFDALISKIFNKNQCALSEIIEKYSQLKGEMESILEEFSAVTSNLNELKSQLSNKESEYNLLKAQKERVHEICNAVTLDIIQRDQDLSSTIDNVCRKLYDMNLLQQNDIDVTLSLSKTVNTLFERLIDEIESKNTLIQEQQNLMLHMNQSETVLKQKDQEVEALRADIVEKENKLQAQKALQEDLKRIYEIKLEENKANFELIEKLTEEINVLKTIVSSKEDEITAMQRAQSGIDEGLKEFKKTIQELKQENDKLKTVIDAESKSQKQAELSNLLQKIEELREDKQKLVTFNEIIVKEKEECKADLDKCNDVIKFNKIEMEKMTSDIIVLKESVKDNVSVIDGLKCEAKSLLDQILQIKQELDSKSQECSRLEMNIKTHEKTAEIQSKMIMRLQKQKVEEEKEKELFNTQLDEMTQKCDALQKDHEALEVSLKASREEIEQLKILKESLETRITELETEVDKPKTRLSIEAIAENSRRRRRSLHDSKRLFAEDQCQDPNKLEAVFESRAKPDDLFMDVDDGGSNRSSPNRHSRGRDSLHARSDHSEEEIPSRPSSVLETRRRRQSVHDQHRSSLLHDPEYPLQKLSEDLTNLKSDPSKHESEVVRLREQLAAAQQELEELQEKYRELDEECETCAQYLREREERCLQLKKENAVLVNQLKETTEILKSCPNRSQTESRPSFAHASVNTDADWANLHSVVVDRMSYDAEVEKSKRLTKTIEELRYNKQELKNVIAKMQRALEKHSSGKVNRELEMTKSELAACKEELAACKEELAELKERYRELDEECETCAEYLRERDEQCRKLREAKAALELKLQQYQEESPGGPPPPSARQKRQTAHDHNRSAAAGLQHAATDTSDDLLSYQVERDNSHGTQAQEIIFLKAALDRVRKEKAALEQLASAQMAMPLVHPTMYVATGSGIVQNQQLTDVMKENQKLKKINAKLVNICKKRSKSAHESNIENEDPEQG